MAIQSCASVSRLMKIESRTGRRVFKLNSGWKRRALGRLNNLRILAADSLFLRNSPDDWSSRSPYVSSSSVKRKVINLPPAILYFLERIQFLFGSCRRLMWFLLLICWLLLFSDAPTASKAKHSHSNHGATVNAIIERTDLEKVPWNVECHVFEGPLFSNEANLEHIKKSFVINHLSIA